MCLGCQGRLADSNKNLVARVMLVIGDLARAMGPPFQQQGRTVLAPALLNLSDSKKHVSHFLGIKGVGFGAMDMSYSQKQVVLPAQTAHCSKATTLYLLTSYTVP